MINATGREAITPFALLIGVNGLIVDADSVGLTVDADSVGLAIPDKVVAEVIAEVTDSPSHLATWMTFGAVLTRGSEGPSPVTSNLIGYIKLRVELPQPSFTEIVSEVDTGKGDEGVAQSPSE